MSFFNLSAEPSSRRSMLSTISTSTNSAIDLVDISVNARVGFRGKGAEAFLLSHDLPIPSQPNKAEINAEGICVLRLSKTEFWLVDSNNSNQITIHTIEQASDKAVDVYRLYCQHSHGTFVVSGEPLANMFAKICAVDLSLPSFKEDCIAQTSVARVNAILVRMKIENRDAFFVLSDIASSDYLWHALLDAALEFE